MHWYFAIFLISYQDRRDFLLYCNVIQQVKQIISRGIPGNRQTRKQDEAILQGFHKKHTGRTIGGCTRGCKFRNLLSACAAIIQKRGL